MVRTCRREFFVELPFFCFYSNSDATEQSGNFLQQMFSIRINSGVKNISGRKSAKIVKNDILKNRIGDNTVFSRFGGVFQKYEFHIAPWSEMPSAGFW